MEPRCRLCGCAQDKRGLPAMDTDGAERYWCRDVGACGRRAEDARASALSEVEMLAERATRARELTGMMEEDRPETLRLHARGGAAKAAERACALWCWCAGALAVAAMIAQPFVALDDG